MISQIVFDLPIDGPFDYLIPDHLAGQITLGMRVKVSLGPRPQMGFVTGILEQSAISKLKPVLSLCDSSAVFNELDLDFARDFSAYYGCSLGEALATMLRNKADHKPSVYRDHQSVLFLYRSHPDEYVVKIKKIIEGYPQASRFLILVPDAFREQAIAKQLHPLPIKIGTRSLVFECDGRYDCVIMVDEQDASYKQEQTPMYETRQVLIVRSKMYGFDITFMGIAPSVELISMVRENNVKLIDEPMAALPLTRLVDLTNYKYIPALISPPVRDALEAAIKAGQKSILVLNRKGSYRFTRCVDCGEILKCSHCDSSLIYSRSEGKFLCRHCTYTAPGDTVCPKCHKPSWRSQGIGVEQVQSELKKQFPLAKIAAFERPARVKRANGDEAVREAVFMPDTRSSSQSFSNCDILISTSAVLRFQGMFKARVVAFIDFDAELNRLDMRGAFNAFSLVLHLSGMASESVYIQTRNINHYLLQFLSRGKAQEFYDEELKLRKEFGFSPFKHWVKISWRGKLEKSVHQAALQVYNVLNPIAPEGFMVTPPLADMVTRKRDQFRFNVMVQANQVPQAVAFIKSALAQVKRISRVIVTLNIDP